jgi:hypothetical protein
MDADLEKVEEHNEYLFILSNGNGTNIKEVVSPPQQWQN